MTITRNRTSNTVVSQHIRQLNTELMHSIAEIAKILGVSEQLVSNALQGQKVGKVNDKAAQYYLRLMFEKRLRDVAEKKVQTLDNFIAELIAKPDDTETVTRLEAANREQADTIAVLKAALRNLI
jgi:predicted transcriptional regulator